jgi:hypothetical protein
LPYLGGRERERFLSVNKEKRKKKKKELQKRLKGPFGNHFPSHSFISLLSKKNINFKMFLTIFYFLYQIIEINHIFITI